MAKKARPDKYGAMTEPRPIKLTVRVSQRLLAKIEQAAVNARRSRADMICQMIDGYSERVVP